MFFGLSDGKYIERVSKDDSGKYNIDMKNINIYNMLNDILLIAGEYAKATDEWISKKVQNVIFQPGNNPATKNPSEFRECVSLMKEVSKGYQRLIKCINSDLAECMKVDKGLLDAIQSGEKGSSEYATDVANKQNVSGKTYSKTGDNAYATDGAGNQVRRIAPGLN